MIMKIKLVVGNREIELNETDLVNFEVATRIRYESAQENGDKKGFKLWYNTNEKADFALFLFRQKSGKKWKEL